MKPQDVISYDNDVVPPFPNLTTQFPKFKFCKSVHHHTVQINQPTRCNNFSSLLLDVYVQFKIFRAFSRTSSGTQQLQ